MQSQIFVCDVCSSLTLPDRVTSPLPFTGYLLEIVYFNQRDTVLGGLVAVNIQEESEIAARQEVLGVALCMYEC